MSSVSSLLCFVFSSLIIYATDWYGQVESVDDGDSLRVKRQSKVQSVNLFGIDAPELQQNFGSQSHKLLSQFSQGKNVSILSIKSTTKSVVKLTGQDESLNEKMLRFGMAWYDTNHCKQDFCKKWKKLEAKARENKMGLWADPYPLAPWRFVKGEKIGVPRVKPKSKKGFHDKYKIPKNIKKKDSNEKQQDPGQ